MIRKGTIVKWQWGNRYATGKVVKTHTETVTKEIKGSKITRNGTKKDKALEILQEDGSKVLKLTSEVGRKN